PAFRSAIWKTGADSLNQEPKLPSNHSKTGTRRPVRQWAHGVAHESSMVRQTCASPFVQQLSTQAKGAATQQGLQRSMEPAWPVLLNSAQRFCSRCRSLYRRPSGYTNSRLQRLSESVLSQAWHNVDRIL